MRVVVILHPHDRKVTFVGAETAALIDTVTWRVRFARLQNRFAGET